MKGEKNMEEVKKVNTEHFKKKIGNTTYRVRVRFLYKGIIINHNKNRANLH